MRGRWRCIATNYDDVGQRWSATLALIDPAPPQDKPVYIALSAGDELPLFVTGKIYDVDIEAGQ